MEPPADDASYGQPGTPQEEEEEEPVGIMATEEEGPPSEETPGEGVNPFAKLSREEKRKEAVSSASKEHGFK